MKKTAYLLLVIALFTGRALAAGRLTSVSVSENGTVMLTTGNPNEFKSSWAGEAGHFKMIIELPGVAVDKTAKVLGNLSANRGIKRVRFSQFSTDPPVARVVIETPERLSYSWSTKPDGVELHFMLPSPLPAAAGTRPETATGFSVPSNVFSQRVQKEDSALLSKRLAITPPPASSARKATAGTVPTQSDRGDVKTAAVPAGTMPTSTTAGPPVSTSAVTSPVAGKGAVSVKNPASGQQKDSTAPTTTASSTVEKTGTTTPDKSTPSAGPLPAPARGGAGVVVKPPSPASGKPVPTAGSSTSTTVTVPAQAPPVSKTASGGTASPASSSPKAKPAVSGPPPPPSTAVTKTAVISKPVATANGKPVTGAAPTSTATAAKPGTPLGSDTVDQAKFKEQLKKALGKLATPEKPAVTGPADSSQKATAPVEKLGRTSFQEQLKKALDPARSLADTGEVADIDDIDTDLPATDEEEEEPFDTNLAIPGGTFMQVSPSRKVIRYHSEGRRDPFSPLTGRDRYASGKKRRAVPAAEQLRLVGIMRSLAGNKVVLEDGEGNGYILAPGDRVRNGYLVSVSENKVLFQVTEYGWTKTVAMELGSFE